MHILHLQTSPLAAHSVSRRLGHELLQGLMTSVTTRDLALQPLPHWSPTWAGDPAAQAEIDQLMGSDVLVVEAPMYNFGLPSTLKTWMDTVAQAGRTFHYTEQGPVGHLTHLKVIILSTRGGHYGEGHAMDFQEAHLRQFFGFLGVTPDRIQIVRAEGLARGEAAQITAWKEARSAIQVVQSQWLNPGNGLEAAA